ncbi:MAG: hypothetical protein KAS32_02525 [Candidatus Peribacteraceae bacterium]|nr:hypothetical protein [Candidatus Peribacteraceae bacterium]
MFQKKSFSTITKPLVKMKTELRALIKNNISEANIRKTKIVSIETEITNLDAEQIRAGKTLDNIDTLLGG